MWMWPRFSQVSSRSETHDTQVVLTNVFPKVSACWANTPQCQCQAGDWWSGEGNQKERVTSSQLSVRRDIYENLYHSPSIYYLITGSGSWTALTSIRNKGRVCLKKSKNMMEISILGLTASMPIIKGAPEHSQWEACLRGANMRRAWAGPMRGSPHFTLHVFSTFPGNKISTQDPILPLIGQLILWSDKINRLWQIVSNYYLYQTKHVLYQETGNIECGMFMIWVMGYGISSYDMTVSFNIIFIY